MWELNMISLLLVILASRPSMQFNIDLESGVIFQGSQTSLFGFSVASHIDQGAGWVLVGAPESETEQRRWGIQRPGAVLRCSAAPPHQCTIIPFDTTGNNNDTGNTIDDKSNQWFGATVSSSGSDGVVVACAPRYVYYSINNKRREPVGTCFTAVESFSRFSEYSPCRTGAWGYHRQGYCQAGLAAAATKERIFIGTPGSYYWQGQTYSQNLWNRMDLIATEEGPETEDNTYLGYSLTMGSFDEDMYPDLVVGMPRGANLTGKVIFLSGRSMTQLHNVTGAQVGAYFGHAVAVSDVNGDGMDDAIIGAPLHTDFGLTDGKYETGRIYVVYQNKEHKFRKWHIRDGETSKGRFGFALAGLGDMDKDGYGDFAVGAPYSGPRGEGAVYIYRGSKAGVRERPDQVIFGGTLRENIRGFGFSLSGGVDLDSNSYPDLAVGAPHSDQTVLLRARPVVNLEAEISFLSEGGNIDMELKGCETREGEKVSCSQIRMCVTYSGVGVDKKLRISTKIELDTKKQLSSRMYFLKEEEYFIQEDFLLTKEIESCRNFDVYLIPNIRDKLTGLESKLTVKLSPTRSELSPVLGLSTSSVEFQSLTGRSEDIELVTRDTVNIQKDCGPDNICIPDLKIFHTCNLEEYSVGSEDRFEINLEIHNHGEDAYEATFYLNLPEAVNYVKTEVMEGYGEISHGSIPVLCSPPTLNNNFVLKCDLGNPMEANSKALLRVVLQPDISSLEDVSSFQMHLEVNSSNPDTLDTLRDNRVEINLPVRVRTDLIIRGLSVPEVIRFNRSEYKDDVGIDEEVQVGPEIMHIYQIENQGPSGIEAAEVYILWPSLRETEDPLLYLTSQPWVEGPGACQFVTDVNSLNIKVDRYRHTYSHVKELEEKYRHQVNYTEEEILELEPVLTEESGFGYSRRKRDVETEFLSELNCGQTKCTFISCVIGPLEKKGFTLIKIRSRLWVRTLDKIKRNDVEISSKLVTKVTKLPYGVNPEYLGFKTHHVTTQVLSLEMGEGGSIPLWILILAILAGLLFLSLLTYILHRLGFFHRQRPDEYDYQATLQEKPNLGKESKNQLVGQNSQYHLLASTPNGSNGSNGSAWDRSNTSNGSAWDRSRSSSQRFSNTSVRNSTNSSTIYYPGQRHPDMQPGDEAL